MTDAQQLGTERDYEAPHECSRQDGVARVLALPIEKKPEEKQSK